MERAARLASDSGDYGESLGWYSFQLGELELQGGPDRRGRGALPRCAASVRSLSVGPRRCREGAGCTRRPRNGNEALRTCDGILPQPELLAALGDIYEASGRDALARKRTRPCRSSRSSQTSSVRYDRQLADLLRRSRSAPRTGSPAGATRAACTQGCLRRRRPRLGAGARRAVRRSPASHGASAPSRNAGSAPLLPPWVRGGMCRKEGRHARLVCAGARAESPVLGSLGAGCATGSSPLTADQGRIIGA